MPFSVKTNPPLMACAAQEPSIFSLQLARRPGQIDSLDGRAFVWAIYGADRKKVEYFDGVVDPAENMVYWLVDGRLSERLYGRSDLKFNIAERLDNGIGLILAGTFTISESAPGIADFDAAPITRQITRILRTYDPDDDTTPDPIFTTKQRAFTAIAAPTSGESNFDLSTDNTMLAFGAI